MAAESPRVLQVLLSLNPGGTERLVLELASRLHAEMPMAVCCIDDRGAWADILEGRGIRVTALSRRAGFRPGLGAGVARAARDHRATVIHAHHYSPFVYACLAKLLRPYTRVIYTEHGRLSDASPSAKRRAANRLFARVPNRVFAVSENLKGHVVAGGFPADAVDVIVNGIDVGPVPAANERQAVRAELGVGDDTLVIGSIARLDPVKDLATLLAAMSAVARERSRPVVVAIIGDGPERTALEGLVRTLTLDDTVRFLGHRDDARRWLSGFDLYANSSISEGVSLTILEAMAAGLPIVATNVGGTPEVVTDACGRLVPSRDPQAIATAILELAAAPSLRQSLGSDARRRVEERFTLDRMIRQYRQAYEA